MRVCRAVPARLIFSLMAAVSETIVREYFELHGFLVRQQRKYIPSRREDEEVDFFVLNPRAEPGPESLPFVLSSAELRWIARGIILVKGWHTETFSSAVLSKAPEIFRFVEPTVVKQAGRIFGDGARVTKILIVPALPQGEAAREESIKLLREKGIDAVIPFRVLLADLVNQIEVNRNYQKSDLLQIIRVLKNYDFFKEQQLELFRGGGRGRRRKFSKQSEK